MIEKTNLFLRRVRALQVLFPETQGRGDLRAKNKKKVVSYSYLDVLTINQGARKEERNLNLCSI